MCIVSASLSNESEASGRSVKEIVESGRSVKDDVYLQSGFSIAWVRNSSVLIFDYITVNLSIPEIHSYHVCCCLNYRIFPPMIQFSCSVVSDCLRTHGLQHTRLP